MPTGYTSTLYDLKPQSFEQFVASCARGFGAYILLRDDAPTDSFVDPVPDAEPSYYERLEIEALGRLERALALRPAEAAVAAIEERAEWAKRRIESAATSMRRRSAYEVMLDHVTEWYPPSEEHAEFQEFMRSQLMGSLDCGRDPWDTYGEQPPLSGQEYRRGEVERAVEDVRRAREQQAEENARDAKRREWVRLLAESVGAVPDFKAS